MSTIDDLRLKILDRPQVVLDERVGTGDGSTKIYKVRHSPVMADTQVVSVGGVEKAEGADYAFDDATGKLTFTAAPSADDAITVSYDFAAFTDAELQMFMDGAGANVALSAGEALNALIVDRTRLVTWSRGSTKVDYDQLRSDLMDVAKRFIAQGSSEVGGKVDEIDWEEVI